MKRPRVHQRPRATPLQGFVAGCVAMLVLFAVTRQSRQPLGKAIIASVTQPHEANQRHAAEMHDLPRVKAAAQVAQQAAPQVTAAAQAVQQAAPQAMAAAVQAVQALPQVTAAAAQAVQALPQVAAAAQAVQVLPQAAAAAVVQPAAAAAALPVAAAVPAQVQGAGQTFEVTVLPLELASGKLTYPHIFEGIKSQLNTERNSCYEGVCFDWYRAAAETFQSGVERAVADRISGALRAAKDRPPVFFDVGANAGFYTVLAGAHGAVAYAFEPQPACASIIQQSVELNKNRPGFGRVKLHNVALKSAPVPDKVAAAAAPAPDDLKIESDGTAKPVDGIDVHLHICHGGFSISAIDNNPTKTRVNMMSLSNFIAAQPRPITALKMDIEANEAGVVSEILPMFEQRKVQHFVVETKPYAWHTKDILPAAGRELFARLAEISQEVYELESNTKVASPAALRELLKVRSDHNLAFKFFD